MMSLGQYFRPAKPLRGFSIVPGILHSEWVKNVLAEVSSIAFSCNFFQYKRQQIVVGVAVLVAAPRLEPQRQISELGNQLRYCVRASGKGVVVREIVDVGNAGGMCQ